MRDITGKTEKVGLIGWPPSHSASPRIHPRLPRWGLILFIRPVPELKNNAMIV